MADFDAPQSRNEAILQNILGADNTLQPPQSRIEILLQLLLQELEGGQSSGVVVDDEISKTSENPVQNKVIAANLLSAIAGITPNASGAMELYSKDLNTITTSGIYNAMTCTNAPSNYVVLIVCGYYLDGYCVQIAVDVTTGKYKFRTQTNGTWSSWGDSILTTVDTVVSAIAEHESTIAEHTSLLAEHSEAIDTLNGTGEGSVSKTVADEVAKIVADAPEDFDTLKEMSDWISNHEDDAAAMNSAIQQNTSAIESLEIGKVDRSDVYTKSEVNISLSAKANNTATTLDVQYYDSDTKKMANFHDAEQTNLQSANNNIQKIFNIFSAAIDDHGDALNSITEAVNNPWVNIRNISMQSGQSSNSINIDKNDLSDYAELAVRVNAYTQGVVGYSVINNDGLTGTTATGFFVDETTKAISHVIKGKFTQNAQNSPATLTIECGAYMPYFSVSLFGKKRV